MVTGIYGVLVYQVRPSTWAERAALVPAVAFRRFADAFVETGRGLAYGTVGAGLVQSIVAYVVLGVPSALALGMLTLIFSVIPAIGTVIVCVPITAGLALTGRTGTAIAMAAIGLVDNVARPFLVKRGQLQLPMFGGGELLGAWGLILGPLIVRLAKEGILIHSDSRGTSRWYRPRGLATPDGP